MEDPRLARLTKICLTLPEAARKDMGSHAAFLVRKSTFAYFLNDHHGDGIVSIACKALPGDNATLAAAQPDRFYLPAYIGREAGSRCAWTSARSIGTKSLNWSWAAIA